MPRIVTPPRGAVTPIVMNRSSQFARQLVGWWPAANRVGTWGQPRWRDATGNGTDLGYIGTSSFDASAWRGNGERLGWKNGEIGNDDCFKGDAGNNFDFNGVSQLTFSQWLFFRDTSAADYENPFSKLSDETYPAFGTQRHVGAGNWFFLMVTDPGGNPGKRGMDSGVDISGGNAQRWVMATCTYDSGTARTYFDGALTATATGWGTEVVEDNYPLILGANPDGHSAQRHYAQADIDDTRVWKRALSAPEIARLYKETRGGGYGSLAIQPRIFWEPSEGAAAVAQSAPIFLATTQAGL